MLEEKNVSFLFLSWLGLTFQKMVLRLLGQTLRDCKWLLYDEQDKALCKGQRKQVLALESSFLFLCCPFFSFAWERYQHRGRKWGFCLISRQHHLILVNQWSTIHEASISQWVMRCQVVFTENISSVWLCLGTCCLSLTDTFIWLGVDGGCGTGSNP